MGNEKLINRLIFFYILFTLFSLFFGYVYSDYSEYSLVNIEWYKVIGRIFIYFILIILKFLLGMLLLIMLAFIICVFNASFWIVKGLITGELDWNLKNTNIGLMTAYHIFLILIINFYLTINTHTPFLIYFLEKHILNNS